MSNDHKSAWRVILAVTALGASALLALGAAGLGTTAALGARGRSAVVGHRAGWRVTDRQHPTIAVAKRGSALADSQSSNWSGYNQGILDTKTPFSSISGRWIVPTATQHKKGQAEDSATWIGIGGGCLNSSCSATDSTLIQAGTEQDVSAAGKATYDAWYEIIPAPETASTIAVHPGDVIHCSISSSTPGLWSIVLKDTTDGHGFTETLPYPSDESTAEWIEETPTVISTSGTGLAALPNLTTVHFSRATVNGASAHLLPAQGIQLTDSSGAVIMTPSKPVVASFNDCAWATKCAAP